MRLQVHGWTYYELVLGHPSIRTDRMVCLRGCQASGPGSPSGASIRATPRRQNLSPSFVAPASRVAVALNSCSAESPSFIASVPQFCAQILRSAAVLVAETARYSNIVRY